MGGYGSSRWGWQQTRADTDGLLWLDVRTLARWGFFSVRPGQIACGPVSWSRRGEITDWITVRYDGNDPDAVSLDYSTRPWGELAWQSVHERIALTRTACHYGGSRPWFLCPGCGSRRAVLYSVGGTFRCRACHDLAYSCTRESSTDRAFRRSQEARKKLLTGPGSVWHQPRRPKGMHWKTYWRICREFERAELAMATDLLRLTAPLERLGECR